MFYNVLIGGAAGQGMDTISSMFEKLLKRSGYAVFSHKDYMSRVRGGHNFYQIRFGDEKLEAHWDGLDVIVALNGETVDHHIGRLKDGGCVICDENAGIPETLSKASRLIKLPAAATAKSLGNAKASNTLLLGALLKVFGMEAAAAEALISEYFSEKLLQVNLAVLSAGYAMVNTGFDVIPARPDQNLLMNGNQAIALGALAAGCKFYAAYPMTPSTTIMNYLADKMADGAIVVEQAEDEIAAVNMALGASYAGARAMTGTSGGGFCLMVEGLGLAAMTETPLVLANIQRPGPTTGFPTRTEQADLKFIVNAAQGEFTRMVIALRNPEDAFYQTFRAFNLADKYQIPVILLGDQYLADYNMTVEPFDFKGLTIERHIAEPAGCGTYKRYEITGNGVSPRAVPGRQEGVTVLVDSDEHDEYGHITESAEMRNRMNEKRLAKEAFLKQELIEPEQLGSPDCDTLFIAWGSVYGPLKEAVERLNREGYRTGALVFGDIWPLPVERIKEMAPKVRHLINVEQNATGQLASLLSEKTQIRCTGSILKYDGRPMSPNEICAKAREVL